MKQKLCKNCEHYFHIANCNHECRRYPPKQKEDSTVSHYPSTRPDNWCGEFECRK